MSPLPSFVSVAPVVAPRGAVESGRPPRAGAAGACARQAPAAGVPPQVDPRARSVAGRSCRRRHRRHSSGGGGNGGVGGGGGAAAAAAVAGAQLAGSAFVGVGVGTSTGGATPGRGARSRSRRASGAAGGLVARLRVAVVGGGPAGACAAEALARCPDIETFFVERKMNNAKPCGGAIPMCMVDEFELPAEIIDRKVRRMLMISPSGREVPVGRTLKPDEYIGMTRREVLDGYLRDRAVSLGAKPINGLVQEVAEVPASESTEAGHGARGEHDTVYRIRYADYQETVAGKGTASALDVDMVIGADGANSRVAKAIDAGDYNYAIAFQERMKLPDDKMAPYEELAEMYVGDDVSPDFYAWVFPKYDHVGVGTGTVMDRPNIKKYQKAIRDRAAEKLRGGKIIKIEAHPIPEHPRPRRVKDRVALVGDAAGYVTKCSGEGIYFAAKSGRMCGEAIIAASESGATLPTERDLMERYIKPYDKKYAATYAVLDTLQKVFYTNDAAREAFCDLCGDDYVQKVTFDSYLYKTVTTVNPVEDIKLLFRTVGSLARGYVNQNTRTAAAAGGAEAANPNRRAAVAAEKRRQMADKAGAGGK